MSEAKRLIPFNGKGGPSDKREFLEKWNPMIPIDQQEQFEEDLDEILNNEVANFRLDSDF